jgi:ribosomal protein S15P/S13E
MVNYTSMNKNQKHKSLKVWIRLYIATPDKYKLKELKEGSDWKAYSCIEYITGLTTMNLLYSSDEFKKKDNKYFSRPQGVTNSQAVRVVLKHLKNNPEDLHESRTFLVVVALREAFSCKV